MTAATRKLNATPALGDSRLPDTFWSKVRVAPGGCWIWSAALNREGYGHFRFEGKVARSHRLAYRTLAGDLAKGMELDHLCRNRACVNPAHLEAVTHQENMLRGDPGLAWGQVQRAKTHCPQGHSYAGENLIITSRGHRRCRACLRESTRIRHQEKP